MQRVLIITLLFFCWITFSAQPSMFESHKFELFKLNNQLPTKSVSIIFPDEKGYIWFGSQDGLIRYDGFRIKTFRSSSTTPLKLISNEIISITADHSNRIWIGTTEGLMILDQDGFSFLQPDIQPAKSQRINALLTDHTGTIWIGTASNGLIAVDPVTMSFKHYTSHANSDLKLTTNSVLGLFEDSYHRIWITTWKEGASLLTEDRKNIQYLPLIGYTNNAVKVFEDADGLIWIGTWDDGIFYVHEDEPGKISFKRFTIASNSTVPVDNIVYNITQDKDIGLIWLITYNGLITARKNQDGSITTMNTNHFFSDQPKKTIHTFCLDKAGSIWLGSIAEGVYRMNFNKKDITNINLNDNKNLISVPPHINKVCEIPGNDLLISVNRAGPFWFDLQTGIIKPTNNAFFNSFRSVGEFFYYNRKDELWISHLGQDRVYAFKITNGNLSLVYDFTLSILPKPKENSINQMMEDNKGNVWFATRNGLYFKAPDKPSVRLNISLKDITTITQDKYNSIWVGSNGQGLYKITTNDSVTSFTFTHVVLKLVKYTCKYIQTIYASDSGKVYVGSSEGFLFSIDPISMNIQEMSTRFGITESNIQDILEDKYGNLWIMTKTNLVKYNTKTNSVIYLDESDGLSNASFFKSTARKLNNNTLVFGGNRGLSLLNPSSFETHGNDNDYKVQITDITINSKSIFDYEHALNYNKATKTLKLSHDQNQIAIAFSALTNENISKNKYAFYLKGLDKDWQYGIGDQSQVNYSGLPYGNYTFYIRKSDPESLSPDKITMLNIRISPPFYLSNTAKISYFALIVIILYLFFRIYSNKLKLKNQLFISQLEQKQSEELTQTKLEYFTNISHELLTPISIISLQIEKLNTLKLIESTHFQMIKDNIFRLKRLAAQILIFKKAESGNLNLTVSKADIVHFTYNIFNNDFRPQFEEKQIEFRFNSEIESMTCFFDVDKLDKILYNLISNASKYTPEKGKIELQLSSFKKENEERVQICVSDSGCGIAANELNSIFNWFYTIKSTNQNESHGVGLSLTKELIELHKGEISVVSELNKGSKFTIQLPVSISSYTDEEIISTKPSDEENNVDENESISNNSKTTLLPKDFCILIVEDNKDLLKLMANHFRTKFHVLTAKNGLKAIEVLSSQSVDLVITDVMMPQMDGLTLCKTIRSTPDINHINILVLTAKNNPADRIDCYNAGADGYISKPFETEVLEARVNNLFEKRKQVIDSFKKSFSSDIEKLPYNPIDQAFMNNATTIIKKHIEEEDLDLDKIAALMFTSKSTLYRKFMYLTGLSPYEFIKNYKLRYARDLLSSKIGNISEIAYSVGFSCPKYFSRCFKTEFGITPSEFRETIWSEINKP